MSKEKKVEVEVPKILGSNDLLTKIEELKGTIEPLREKIADFRNKILVVMQDGLPFVPAGESRLNYAKNSSDSETKASMAMQSIGETLSHLERMQKNVIGGDIYVQRNVI